jgi:hypothetical protein
LAGTQLLLAFEQVQSSIFGSQIALLKKLNEVAGQGIRKDLVNEYIEKIIKSKPNELEGWTAEQYLLFLRSSILIVNVKDTIHITERGVEYLIWMVRNGRNEDRPL